MNKKFYSFGAALLCASLTGCGGDSDSSDSGSTTPKLNALTVALLTANTQQPIGNAEVIIVAENQKSFTRMTNAEGQAKISLENGNYEISTAPQGYESKNLSIVLEDEDKTETIVLEEKDAIVPGEELYIFHSEHDDSHYMQYWGDTWGSGAIIEEVNNDPTFDKVLRVSSGTNWGHGAAIAWGNEQENAIDASAYNYAQFYVKPNGFRAVEVNVQGFSIPDASTQYSMADGVPVGDTGWLKFEVPIPTARDLKWFGLVFLADDASDVLLSNVSFITKEVELSQPSTSAPIPTVQDDEVFSIFSDSLKEDKFISLWNENWWNAPLYSAGSVNGNNYSRYEIVGAGSEGGVVGIQYGIEYGSVDVSMHDTWNIDLYAEEGIDMIKLQLVSTDGSATYEINNVKAGEWATYSIPLKNMNIEGPNALNARQMQMAGIQMWGTAGSALFVDNIYFSGMAEKQPFSVTVTDENGTAINDALVFVGNKGEYDTPYEVKTNAQGIAQLELNEGQQKIRATAAGYGVAQHVAIVGEATSLEVALKTINTGPTEAAPVPTVDSSDVISLYSDNLTSDHWITYWSDNWWNAPKQEDITINGNKTSKFTIIADGVEGGVTGIQYGVENPVDASNMTGMRFDFFATSGITKAEFQLVSASGPIIYTKDNIETGKWITVELPFRPMINFDKSKMQQLGMGLWGTTSDSVYLDNIYFY
ncbi:carboxypeptidase-like regulatory domain-containing protein [Vibrio alfacsensis]|uniref:carboxypeptidase-like regulatory domain-containing protein n=1 Tax=Vibrio TaxID=662 RepID=UPI0040692B77